MMIIIIVLLVVLLGTVVAVSVYVLNIINAESTAVENGTAGVTRVRELSVKEKTTVVISSKLSTNLSRGTDGDSHIAQLAVSLQYDNTTDDSVEFGELVNANIPLAKSVAIECITSFTYEELELDPDGRAILADKIKLSLQEEFNTTLIVNVIFDEWLIL